MTGLPRWIPVRLDTDDWDLHFPKRNVVYGCKGEGCMRTFTTLKDAKAHEAATGHSEFFLREGRDR